MAIISYKINSAQSLPLVNWVFYKVKEMENIKNIAYYVVNYFQEREDFITNLKLQKLLYYVQGWHLAINKTPAFDEDFQAWIHGPVNNEVYQEYKSFQWRPILAEHKPVTLNEDLKQLVDKVLDVYGNDSAIELELRTHRETPWLIARDGLPEDATCNTIITKDTMYDYFSKLIA